MAALAAFADVVYWLSLIVLAGGVLSPVVFATRAIRKGASPWIVALPLASGAYLALLGANAIDVSRWPGRALYGLVFFLAWLLLAIGLFAFNRLGSPMSARIPWALRLLQGWWVVVIVVLMTETVFRIFPAYDSLANNPGIEFFWPDWIHHPLNGFGHRDREFTVPKPDDTYRIVLLGDSFTEGAGLTRDQTFGRLLEASLNQRVNGAGTVEVYNLGHCGLNAAEEVALLLRDGPQLAPDLVVLSYVVVNDAETHPLTVTFSTAPAWVAAVHGVFMRRLHSFAYYWLATHVTVFPPAFRDAEDLAIALHDPKQRGWQDVVTALDQAGTWLAARQIPAVALVWPFFSDDWRDRGGSVHRQVDATLTHHGFAVHDLLTELADRPASAYALSSIDVHPNAVANREVAERLAEIVWRVPSMQRFATKR